MQEHSYQIKMSYKHVICTFKFSSCVHYEDNQNITKHTRKTGCLFCFFIYASKIGFKFCNKKGYYKQAIFQKKQVFLRNFHQMRQPLRNTLAKTLEHLYFGTSHYLLNAVVLLPNSFNSYNCEGCKLLMGSQL